jgi:hypothetical protein
MLKQPIVVSNSRALVKMTQPKYRHGQPVSSSVLRGVMTDDVLQKLEANWKLNSKVMIEGLGSKWLCHPDNFIKRKDGKVYK